VLPSSFFLSAVSQGEIIYICFVFLPPSNSHITYMLSKWELFEKDESRSRYNSIHSLKQTIFHSCDRPMHSTVSLHPLLFALVNSHHITDRYAAHDIFSWRCQSDRSTPSKNRYSFFWIMYVEQHRKMDWKGYVWRTNIDLLYFIYTVLFCNLHWSSLWLQ